MAGHAFSGESPNGVCVRRQRYSDGFASASHRIPFIPRRGLALSIEYSIFYPVSTLLKQFFQSTEAVAVLLPARQKFVQNFRVGLGGGVQQNDCPRVGSG